MTKRYLGNIITQNPTAPAGNFEGSAAKGVWSLEEQLAYQKAGLWPIPGNLPPDITDVFSTYLYEGTGSAQTITNGIDLAGEGGMVWIKGRNAVTNHALIDTERGGANSLASDTTAAQRTDGAYGLTFNSNGFDSTGGNLNVSGREQASWTFRKAPKFFTCLTYTGTGSAQNISHDLGSVPGTIIIKGTDYVENWIVYHRSLGETKYIQLNTTGAASTSSIAWNDTAPTSTEFTVNTFNAVNESGYNYVAYLFAHNDGDGGFGPDGSDIIKCGSYTGGGSTDVSVDLGFEPQWLLIKASSRANEWMLVDVMRGAAVDGDEALLIAEGSSAEFTGSNNVNITPTGFDLVSSDSRFNDTGETYIYISIRRGPLAQPTAGTEVFAVDIPATGVSAPTYQSSFPVDMALGNREFGSTGNTHAVTRLTGNKRLQTNLTNAESADGDFTWDFMDGYYQSPRGNSTFISWMWKRAPGYFDAVAYTGNNSSNNHHTINHNLGVAPEMIWYKRRDSTGGWGVLVTALGTVESGGIEYGQGAYLNETSAFATSGWWGSPYVAPTATEFTVRSDTPNASGGDYIAYLFASLPGISKVGSYTGNGTSQTIDCGFTSGARFILIKRSNESGGWYVWDTERGIVAGNDPFLQLNSTAAELTGDDSIDPDSSGFIVNQTDFAAMNVSGGEYIFYAIA